MGSRSLHLMLLLLILSILATVTQAVDADDDAIVVDLDEDEDDDDEDFDDEDDDDEDSLVGKQTRYITSMYFPKYQDKPIPAGEIIDCLATFSTPYLKDGQVLAIRGQIASPFDHRKAIQNFSLIWYNDTVDANRERSFWYRFMVAPDLEPREYTTTFEMFYLDNTNNTRLDLVFNKTLTITSGPASFDFKTISSYLMFFALVGGLAFTAYTVSNKPHRVSASVAPIRPNEVVVMDDDDFAPLAVKAWKKEKEARSSGRKGSSKR